MITRTPSYFPLEAATDMSKVCELLINAQHEMNKTVRHDWPAAEYPFHRAAHTEIGEAFGYMSWEWWKNLAANWHDVFRTESDRDDFHMELVDAFHFMISAHIQRYWGEAGNMFGYWELTNAAQGLFRILGEAHNKSIQGEWSTYFSKGVAPIEGPEATLQRVEELQTSLLQGDLNRAFGLLVEVANHTGLGLDGLLGRYFAKNVLNLFRAANGYKEKTYIKSWGEGKEDNFYLNREVIPYLSEVSLEELLAQVSEGHFQANLKNKLTSMYSRVTRNGHCDHEAAEASSPAHGNPSGHE